MEQFLPLIISAISGGALGPVISKIFGGGRQSTAVGGSLGGNGGHGLIAGLLGGVAAHYGADAASIPALLGNGEVMGYVQSGLQGAAGGGVLSLLASKVLGK